MSKYRDFSLSEVLFLATGGRMCTPLHRQNVDEILDLVSYMVGRDAHMLEMQEIARMCKDFVLGQYPCLAEVVHRVEAGELHALRKAADGNELTYQLSLADWFDSVTQVARQRFTLVPLVA